LNNNCWSKFEYADISSTKYDQDEWSIYSVIIFLIDLGRKSRIAIFPKRLPFELKKMVGRELARCANAKIPSIPGEPGIVSRQSSDSRNVRRETFGVKAPAAERHHLARHMAPGPLPRAATQAAKQAGTPDYMRHLGHQQAGSSGSVSSLT